MAANQRQFFELTMLVSFILRPCQHDNGYTDGRSQIYAHATQNNMRH